MKKCKVYRDGGMHYIAIAPSEGYSGVRRKPPPEEPIVVVDQSPVPGGDEKEEITQEKEDVSESGVANEVFSFECSEENAVEDAEDITATAGKKRISTRSEEFLRWYRESLELKKKERYSFIASKMAPYFTDKEELHRFLHRKLACRERAKMTKRLRCIRRAALHDMNYFCTFTYDSKKMNEEEFEKKLLNTLSHFASRKGWKYMGTWERGKDTDRLHFHAIMHIPEGTMSGELVKKREYDVKKKRMVERIENTFFEKKYGRNTFEFVDGTALTVNTAIEYIIKYLEKDGGRIICSKGLHTFLETDIDNKDIVCRLRAGEDKKYILFDDFKVYKDGKELGTISPGVLANAKTVE